MKKIKVINKGGVLYPETPFPETMTSAVCDGEHYIVFENEDHVGQKAFDDIKMEEISPVEVKAGVAEKPDRKKTLWEKIKAVFSRRK